MPELGRYVTAHFFRFPEIRVPESLALGGKPAGAISWKIGSTGPVGPDGYRMPGERWAAVGLFRNLDEAQASLEAKESYLPFLPEVVESWHMLLLPVMHRGECNHLNREEPGLCFEVATEDPGGQLVVITTPGFVLGPNLDVERVIDFRRKVDEVHSFMQSSDGHLASAVFTPHTYGDDGFTMTVWRNDAAMLSAAYRPADHRTQVDRYKKKKTADRTSCTRFVFLKLPGNGMARIHSHGARSPDECNLVHGAPDTFRVWQPVIHRLTRKDVVALALPGFGEPLPAGFQATKEEYVAWIIERLEREPEPVDLVGHDWGCILTARVASLRPDLVRTWAAGGAPVHKDYVWHPLAKIYQTPGAGEDYLRQLDSGQYRQRLEGFGVPSAYAVEAVQQIDDRMKECMLRLYRSAVTVRAEWQPDLKNVSCPSMVLWGAKDQPCPIVFADLLAADLRASRVLKLDTGHWFELERPEDVAKALEEDWAQETTK